DPRFRTHPLRLRRGSDPHRAHDRLLPRRRRPRPPLPTHPKGPPMTTHTVLNQPAPRVDVDEYSTNTALVEAVTALAPDTDTAELRRIGRLVGSASFQHDAAIVHTITPQHS